MKMRALLVVAVGLLTAVVTLRAEEAKKDKDSLAGAWTIVSMHMGGQENEQAKGDKVTFANGKITVKGQGGDHEGTYKVHTDKTPKQIDFTPSDGDQAGQVHKGIYELKGEKLTIVLAPPDQARPKDFKGKDNEPVIVVVLKRDKV